MASNDNGLDLGIEASLFKTADKLRGNTEPSDYKHVALGLIFLKLDQSRFRSVLLRATVAVKEAGYVSDTQ